MRIATYNVRNLFTPEEALGRGVPERSEAELKALAGTVAAVNADVWMLQEVGSVAALALLNDRLALPYPFVEVLPGNSNRGIHLAVLSREPFELTSHRDRVLTDGNRSELLEFATEADARASRTLPLKVQRDFLLVELGLADEPGLAIFNVHLKSQTNRNWRLLAADVIRSAESAMLAQLIRDYLLRHPERMLLLAGDFNDTRYSDALRPLFDLPLSDPLGEMLSRSNRNPSTYWPKRRMRLDFILTSEAAQRQLVPDSPRIHANQRARRASDHYPVSIDLRLTGQD